jgi:hypothetical protein
MLEIIYLWLHYLDRGISTGKGETVNMDEGRGTGFNIDYIQNQLRRILP